MLKKLLRQPWVQWCIGRTFAHYLRFVRLTTRWQLLPADLTQRADAHAPFIAALWHGQHFMIPLAKKPHQRFCVLISHHRDGGINAAAAEAFGIQALRGAGSHSAKQKGGVAGMLAMLRALEDGCSVTLTADVPKVSRVAGMGIIKLAQHAQRPIVPVAVVCSRKKVFASWDRACIGLPFGRGVMALGEPLNVPDHADDDMLEALRLRLEAALERLHAEAYGLLGQADPGSGVSRRANAAGSLDSWQ